MGMGYIFSKDQMLLKKEMAGRKGQEESLYINPSGDGPVN